MRRPTTIRLEDLPPRVLRLSDDETASIFGGCVGRCWHCQDDKDCCIDYGKCRLGTNAVCPNLSEYGANSKVMVCQYG